MESRGAGTLVRRNATQHKMRRLFGDNLHNFGCLNKPILRIAILDYPHKVNVDGDLFYRLLKCSLVNVNTSIAVDNISHQNFFSFSEVEEKWSSRRAISLAAYWTHCRPLKTIKCLSLTPEPCTSAWEWGLGATLTLTYDSNRGENHYTSSLLN